MRGMVLGKFMPPHLGHVYLVDVARRIADELTVVVGTLQREPIPGELRYQWMRELFPHDNVVHLRDENPQDPSEHPEFWTIWRESLQRILPHKPDVVFASEAYGHRLAHELGARFIPVDPGRGVVSVSGTAVRNDPMASWCYLPNCVRPYFVKRVCVVGAESTGKTTLVNALADVYETAVAPEFARTYLEAQNGAVTLADMAVIAKGQVAVEEAAARQANRLLICDTDLSTTAEWSIHLFAEESPAIEAAARARTYDLYLLTDPDVPFAADNVRYHPERRREFFERMRARLDACGSPYVVIRGDKQARLMQACGEIAARLKLAHDERQ